MRSLLGQENRELLRDDTSAYTWLLQLLGVRPITFEFLAEQPLHQCIQDVKRQQENPGPMGWLFGSRQVVVDVWPIDAQAYGFRVQKRQRGRNDVSFSGSITSMAEAACEVRG